MKTNQKQENQKIIYKKNIKGFKGIFRDDKAFEGKGMKEN